MADVDVEESARLEVLDRLPGRAILAESDSTFYVGRNYDILRSDDGGRTWAGVAILPRSPWRRAAEGSRLACRLLRHEVRALARLPDGSYVAANREGIFHGTGGVLQPCEVEKDGAPVHAPMRITVGPGGEVLWGEYCRARRARGVRLYASNDGGSSFRVIHTLEAGSVLHIHNILHDPRLDHYWVLAGDHDHEPGIGMLSRDLERFEWFVKGEQRYRAVIAFDFDDRLVYATDTEREPNALISLDKHTGKTEHLRSFDGSCIYGCRFGGLYAITTTVEPSPVNRSPWARLWLSRDAIHWKLAWQEQKDRWSGGWFQFGSIVLPAGATRRESILFSGQAIEGLDGQTVLAELAPDAGA